MSFLKNRTVVGVICILLSLLICFGLTPLFNQSVSQKAEIVRVPYALWNSCGCNSISKGCDTGWNGMGTSNTRHTAVAGLDPSGRNRSYPSSRARKGESCDGGKRPADKRQRPPNPG